MSTTASTPTLTATAVAMAALPMAAWAALPSVFVAHLTPGTVVLDDMSPWVRLLSSVPVHGGRAYVMTWERPDGRTFTDRMAGTDLVTPVPTA